MRCRLFAFCLAATALTPLCPAAQTQTTQPKLHLSQDNAINVTCKLAETKTALSSVTDPAKRTVLINAFNNCVSSRESLGTLLKEQIQTNAAPPPPPPPATAPKPTEKTAAAAAAAQAQTQGQQLTQSVWGTPDACAIGTAGALAAKGILFVHRALVWPKEASDNFGRRLGKRFVIYQVTITNASTDFQYAVSDIVVDLAPIYNQLNVNAVTTAGYSPTPPAIFQASSQDLEMLRGVAEKGQDYDPRNMTLHIMQGVGSVAAAVSGLTPFSDVFGPAMANYNGAFLQAIGNTIFPDHTTTQLNRLSDMAFSTNNLIGKLQTKKYTVFIPNDLVMYKNDQGDYWGNTRSFLNNYQFDQLNICVDGLLLVQAQATPAPTFSTTEAYVVDGETITLSDSADGAVIYYTTDGNPPSTNSNKYTASIPITAATSPVTIQAFAVAPNQAPSTTVTSTYTVASKSGMPTLACSTDGSKTYTVTPAHQGDTVFISTDGKAPTRQSPSVTTQATSTYTGDSVNIQAIEAADKEALSDPAKLSCPTAP
jgi:hypothetical protein